MGWCMDNKQKKSLIKLMMIMAWMLLISTSTYLINEQKRIYQEKNKEQSIKKMIDENEHAFDMLAKINPDLLAILNFDDAFISLPIVKGTDNAYYLQHAFDGSYSSQGTAFVDARYQNTDQIMFIYGHNVYYDPNAMFSPLASLLNQDEFERYDKFELIYQDHKESYGICMSLLVDVEDQQVMQTQFASLTAWQTWYERLKSYAKLEISYHEPSFEDKLIILQTCYERDVNKRIWIVAKKIS